MLTLTNALEIEELSTEERIKAAATKVFIEKGFAATKTRDIAVEAGINIASLHYYFRSKEKLFDIVISEALLKFSDGIDNIFNSEFPLQEKIKMFAGGFIDFLKANPFVPIFIMSESQKNPKKVNEMMSDKGFMPMLKAELEELIEKGVIRPISPVQFFLNLLSLTIFPFIARPLVTTRFSVSQEDYDQLLEDRKQLIPQMIIDFLYTK